MSSSDDHTNTQLGGREQVGYMLVVVGVLDLVADNVHRHMTLPGFGEGAGEL